MVILHNAWNMDKYHLQMTPVLFAVANSLSSPPDCVDFSISCVIRKRVQRANEQRKWRKNATAYSRLLNWKLVSSADIFHKMWYIIQSII